MPLISVHNAMFPEGLILNNQIPKLKMLIKHTIKRIQLAEFQWNFALRKNSPRNINT